MGRLDEWRKEKKKEIKEEWNELSDFAESLQQSVSLTLKARNQGKEVVETFSTPAALSCLGGLGVVCFAAGWKANSVSRAATSGMRRMTSVADIPSESVGTSAPWLRGRVVSVSDGDTVRFLHAPTWFHSSTLEKGEKMSQVALPIRVCTIDTPETAKFGKSGQPFGEEAKECLENLVKDKMVQVKLLQKDQYGRGVAEVKAPGFLWWNKYADQVLLKSGLAEVYRGSGAVYGHLGKDAYIEMEERAKNSKTGMWSQGDKRESAAEYKARTK